MRHACRGFLGMLLLLGACRTTEPVGLRYGPHSPPEEQRIQAQRVDPYPATETGPQIEGGRPPGYENPPPEIRRVQPDRWGLPFGG